jgi:hypothetical protein
MPLPFREEEPKMPNNKFLALHRLAKLKTRLENNEQYRKDYVAFMNDLVSKKYVERVPEKELSWGVSPEETHKDMRSIRL